ERSSAFFKNVWARQQRATIIFFVTLLFCHLVTSLFASQYWISQNWQKRIPITINNGGSALTDYQVWIATSEFSSAQWSDIKGGTGQLDLDDVRFTKSDKITPLNYWIDSDTNNPAGFWVKVPSVPAGNSTIYIYYGNNIASAGNSFETTMQKIKDTTANNCQLLLHFDGGTSDYSGNNYTGDLYDNANISGEDGGTPGFSSGNHINLDGSEDYYRVDANLLNQIPLTIEAWFTTDQVGTRKISVICNDNPGNYGAGFGIDVNGKIEIDKHNDFIAGLGTALETGKWYHVAVVYVSGTQICVYQNGNEIYNNTVSDYSASLDGRTVVDIGMHNDSTMMSWQGWVDEVAVYNKALSKEKIKCHYKRRKYAATEPTVSSVGTAETVDTVDPVVTQLGAYHKNAGGSWLGSSDWNDDVSPDVKIQVQDTGAGLRVGQTEIAPSSGCVLMMHFNEGSGTTINDTSGYGNNGALSASTGSWTTGKFGNAYNFNGFDEFVDCGDDTSLNITNAITIGAWVKLNELRWVNSIIEKGNEPINKIYWLYRGDDETRHRWTFEFGDGTLRSTEYYSEEIDLEKWYYVIATFDTGDVKIYINGKKKKESISSIISLNTSGYNTLIGAYKSDSPTHFLNGAIDEVGIWNRALTAEEIAAMYNSSCVKYSTDNGSSWTIEPSTSVVFTSGADGTTSVEISTALAVPLAESGTDNLVRFITSDKAGNVAESASYTIKADTTAPVNNGLCWLRADNYNQLTLEGTAADLTSGLNTNGWWFEETSGNPGGSDSTVWESTSVYSDSGLKRNTQYSYRVKMRDKAANESGWSTAVNKKTQPCVWQEKTTTRTGPNAFGFEGDGVWTWKVPVNGGSLVTITGYIRYNSDYGGAAKPKFTLYNNGVNNSATASIAAADAWEKLTVSGTPSGKGVLFLKVEGFSTAVDAKYFVDDIQVNQP
ncbi:MAG: DUF2341 domain-containing protein, partial [Elusimicrobia bacterium]|nr:DUF2341 domain-containing protein [Elusimicrobiota bacterium]